MAQPPPDREEIAAALYSLLDASVGAVVQLQLSSRRLRDIQRVDTTQMPALFLAQGNEHYERKQGGLIGLPPVRTMRFAAVIYVADPQEDSVVAVTQMNALVKAVETALAPGTNTGSQNIANNMVTGIQTLGGLVASARINGEILYLENLENDGKSASIIPIEVIRP